MAFYFAIVIGSALCAYFLGLLDGALYVPTSRTMVEEMLDLASLTPEDTLVDIGSGDGRLVIAAARRGIRATGYEINPILVWWSNRAIRKAGLSERAHVVWKDFWSVDFAPYSVVTVFGIAHIMGRLEKKLARELEPGSRVVCNLFDMPNWEGKKADGMFLYQR